MLTDVEDVRLLWRVGVRGLQEEGRSPNVRSIYMQYLETQLCSEAGLYKGATFSTLIVSLLWNRSRAASTAAHGLSESAIQYHFITLYRYSRVDLTDSKLCQTHSSLKYLVTSSSSSFLEL